MQLTTTQPMRTLPGLYRNSPKYALLRAALRLGGHLSDGLATGFAHGFDSGSMLDYVYRNHASGRSGLGRVIDRIYLNQLGWRASRARKTLVQSRLRNLLLAQREQGRQTHILDVAAGPGRYNLEVLRALGGADISLTCRDTDMFALTQGQRLAAELQFANRVSYERGDATDPDDLARVTPRPDIVIVSGLYEILIDDAAVCRSLLGIRTILSSGGTLLFTTQVAHPQLTLIANVLHTHDGRPWVMGTRPLARVERWAREAGFSGVESELEPHGLFGVTRCMV